MIGQLYVIEAREPDGSLSFAKPQPEEIFGRGAITGIDEDAIAKVVWRHKPDAVLTGETLLRWPALVDERFRARAKYW